jgi:hypothetical protein
LHGCRIQGRWEFGVQYPTDTRTTKVYDPNDRPPGLLTIYRRPARLDPLGVARRLGMLGSAGLGVAASPYVSSALAGRIGLRGRCYLDGIGSLLTAREWASL